MSTGLLHGLAAGPQRCWSLRTGLRHDEQIRDRHRQGEGHRLQRGDGDVLRAALDAADIGPVDAGGERESLLRMPARNAQAPQVPADDATRVRALTTA